MSNLIGLPDVSMKDDYQLMPDPQRGSVAKEGRLSELARTHRVMRMSAENGLSVDDAIRVIETLDGRLAATAFPAELIAALK